MTPITKFRGLSTKFEMAPAAKTSHKPALRWLLKQTAAAKTWIALSITLGLVSGILLIAQARFLALIVHAAFIEKKSVEVLWPLFGTVLGIILARALLSWAREMSGFLSGAKIRQEVRMTLLEHLMSLGPAFGNRQRTGALAVTALEHVEGLHDFYAAYLPQLGLAVAIPSAVVAFIFPHSWAAAGLLIVTAPLIPLFMILVGMGAESVSQSHFRALARMSSHFLDVLQGLTTLKLFGRSKGEESNIAAVSENYRGRTMRVLRVAFLSSAVLEFFASISIALVAVYLAMVYLGYIDFGTYGKPLSFAGGFFILLLAPDFYLPLRELGTHYHARAEAIGAVEEILKILSAPRTAAINGSIPWVVTGHLHLQFQEVHLAFDGGRRSALRGITFDLRKGETVAVVGASGAGKTTLLNLLLGFLQPDRGRILVNKIALTDLTASSWRRQVAWIGQFPVLFHGSIRENIILGRQGASELEIEHAAAAARVSDFARLLPDGLDTPVGERGIGLSRGQAQRVALARAFLKDAPMLLLDEPTAGLDAENENLVLDGLEELSRGRTVLLTTHRLARIHRADRILVLRDGTIVEQGSYPQLVAARGLFYRFLERTSGGKTDA